MTKRLRYRVTKIKCVDDEIEVLYTNSSHISCVLDLYSPLTTGEGAGNQLTS